MRHLILFCIIGTISYLIGMCLSMFILKSIQIQNKNFLLILGGIIGFVIASYPGKYLFFKIFPKHKL